MIDFLASNWVFRSALLTVLFVAVVLGCLFLANYAINRISALRGLRSIQSGDQAATAEGLTNRRSESAYEMLVRRIEQGGLDLSDSNEGELSKLMKNAGYMSPAAPQIYTLVRVLLIFVLPGLYIFFTVMTSETLPVIQLYIVCSILAVLGLYGPNLFVRYKAHRRRTAIVNGFPDSLDLMLVCVEAGLGLESALDRCSREMAVSHPLISSLFAETVLLMRAGASRDDALRKLADGSGVDEVRSFTTLLIQSDKLGTSITQTLRVYSAEMREARKMRAEEKAHRLPVLISIPLVVFMLPTIIGVVALPAIVLAIRDVVPALN